MLASAAHRGDASETAGLHRFPYAVPHEPRGLVGDAEHAMALVRADALLAAAHQVESSQLLRERDMAALEHGEHLVPALPTRALAGFIVP